jgi:DNA polymerase-3 subunit epsilon
MMVVDFESTGSVPGYPDQPWQIGLVPVVDGEVIPGEAWETYLHVPEDRPFNPLAPGSWRLVRDQLATAPTLATLWPELRGRVSNVPLVAHNVATEKKFFRAAWPLHRFGPWIDTLKLSRLGFKGLASYDLEQVSGAAGIHRELSGLLPGRAPHDALYDAMASALVLCHLLRQPHWQDITVSGLSRAASR